MKKRQSQVFQTSRQTYSCLISSRLFWAASSADPAIRSRPHPARL